MRSNFGMETAVMRPQMHDNRVKERARRLSIASEMVFETRVWLPAGGLRTIYLVAHQLCRLFEAMRDTTPN